MRIPCWRDLNSACDTDCQSCPIFCPDNVESPIIEKCRWCGRPSEGGIDCPECLTRTHLACNKHYS